MGLPSMLDVLNARRLVEQAEKELEVLREKELDLTRAWFADAAKKKEDE